MASYRPVRVGELIQSELATMLARELKDPRLQMVTISYVEVTPDLRQARVHVSRLGSEAEQNDAIEAFQRATGFIRGQLGKRLNLRYIPQLTFALDTGIEYGVRISSMLHDLVPKPSTEGLATDNPEHEAADA